MEETEETEENEKTESEWTEDKADELMSAIEEATPDAVLIGNDENRWKYLEAVVGFDCEMGKVIYSYMKLLECFKKYGMTEDEAIEWVDYNVIRALPYYGDHSPIIMLPVEMF